jgi:type IV secretory pathway VirB10-like protein
MPLRAAAGALALALVLASGACGGDDEEPETTASPPPTTEETTTAETEQTATEGPTTEEETAPRPAPETETETEPPSTSPEDQQGGAGDEEPARSLALFMVQNGRVTPRVVRVPAFISIRVELRANDGNTYALTIGGKTLAVGERVSSVSVTLDGLRPGDAYVGTLQGADGRVRIEATAEPGP